MNKTLSILSLLFVSCSANAGVGHAVAGGVVGYALGHADKTTTNLLLTSKDHDVIVCKNSGQGDTCQADQHDIGAMRNPSSYFICYNSVQDYARQAGYSKVYKRSVQFIDGVQYIVLEVGNEEKSSKIGVVK